MRYIMLLTTLIGWSLGLFAQKNTAATVQQDPALIKGTLKNGLTYYIRQNQFPKGHADFHIFHAVGAIHEKDHQNGLAHFLEHMAFKGLKHLPGNQLLDYMEKNGVKFGPNLNASTSFDYTHYMLQQVPVDRPGLIDTCLLVLSDWSGGILADPQAIELERGVIREEFRSRSDVGTRSSMALQPFYYQGSKYAERTVIGDMDIIANFERDDLMDFYHHWYKPEMQAIAIVGDFDPQKMEKLVIDRFSELPTSYQLLNRPAFPLPDNREPIIARFADQEVAAPSISLLFKQDRIDPQTRNSVQAYANEFVNRLVINMMNQRWSELAQASEPELSHLGFSFGEFVSDKSVFAVHAAIKSGKENIVPGFSRMLDELSRFYQSGFSQIEFERIKADALKNLERRQKEAGRRTHRSFVNAYLANFLESAPLPALETQAQLHRSVLDTIGLSHITNKIRTFMGEENRIMTWVIPEAYGADIPSDSEIRESLQTLKNRTVSPYQPTADSRLIPSQDPTPGKVVKSESSKFGTTLWTLSNGAKVYILPTTHQQDEVLLNVMSPGGKSVIADEDLPSSHMVVAQLMNAGVGPYDAVDLKNALNGKIVYVTPFLSDFSEGFSTSASPTDLETMLTWVHMYFMEPRFDQAILHKDLRRFAESMEVRNKNPMSSLQDSVLMARSNYHPRSLFYLQDTSKVDLELIQKLHAEHFANPADFTWTFTGAVDLESLKPLVEKYIGSLPDLHRPDQWKDLGQRSPKGLKKIEFKREMETPKSITFIEYAQETPFTLKKLFGIRLLKDILEVRLKELLRDEKSAVYTTEGEGSFAEQPIDKLQFIVSFQTDTEKMDELTQTVFDEVHRLAKDGIPSDILSKSKEYMRKMMEQSFENNNYWQYVISSYISTGRDKHTWSLDLLDSITERDLQSLLAGLLESNSLVHVTMHPQE